MVYLNHECLFLLTGSEQLEKRLKILLRKITAVVNGAGIVEITEKS